MPTAIEKGKNVHEIKPAPTRPRSYGTEPPEIRLRLRGKTQQYFCRINSNLHLTDEDFQRGEQDRHRGHSHT